MLGVFIHGVDVLRSVVAGMQAEFRALIPQREIIAAGALTSCGVQHHSALAARLARGYCEALFYVRPYYRAKGVALPQTPFPEVVRYDFGINDLQRHYHLLFKCAPCGYSCFRGGA